MKATFSVLILVSLAILTAACQGAYQAVSTIPDPPNATSTVASPAVIATEAPAPDQSPTPTFAPDEIQLPLSQYGLTAQLNYDTHEVVVEQHISYVNTTGSDLNELLLLIEPNQYPAGFQLEEISWENGDTITDYSLSGRELVLPLLQSLSPMESIELNLRYRLNLPNQTAPYGCTDRQTNLGDWYPYVPPYIPGEGWLVREVAFLGEHTAYDMASFEVEIQLTSPSSASGGLLTIAASSLPETEGDIYRYQHSPARNFAWTVSDQYQVLETQVDEFTVKSYSFPFHPSADEPALTETAKALTIFDDLFGPYPHQALSVVEADFLDGMEYDGLIFLSHAFYDYYTGDHLSNLTIIAAHEVAHQWWYGQVGNDQALEPWLDEALSTFSELYYYENAYPEDVGWWWENRILFHDPQGWVDSTIYESAGFYPYRDAVYLRGAMFLGELRDLMGQEAFLDFLHDYLKQYNHRQVTGDDFFDLLSAHTSADLSGLISSYFANR